MNGDCSRTPFLKTFPIRQLHTINESIFKVIMSQPETIVGITTVTAVLVGIAAYFMGNSSSTTSEKAVKPSANASRARAGSLSNEEKYPAGRMNIFFGSQTGTAEGFARIIQAEGHKKGFDAKLMDLEDFETEQLTSTEAKLSVFLVATYGEGEPTDNAAQFCEWALNENGEIAEKFLSSMKYCVFGLGNTDYENYNK